MMITPIESDDAAEDCPIVVYDGGCRVSAALLRRLRLRRAAGPVAVVDVRRGWHPVLGRLREAGIDPRRGIVVELGGQLHHGAEAMTVLALITAPEGAFARVVTWAFRSQARARLLFPAMEAGRKLVGRLLGPAKA